MSLQNLASGLLNFFSNNRRSGTSTFITRVAEGVLPIGKNINDFIIVVADQEQKEKQFYKHFHKNIITINDIMENNVQHGYGSKIILIDNYALSRLASTISENIDMLIQKNRNNSARIKELMSLITDRLDSTTSVINNL